MTMAPQGIYLFNVAIGVIALACLFYWPWSRLMVDIARQRLFEVRERLFLLAADGQIAFDHPAYLATRAWLNSSLQFCHFMTFSTLLASVLSDGERERSLREPNAVERAIETIEVVEVRQHFDEAVRQTGEIFVVLMVVRNPLLLVGVVIFTPLALVSEFVAGASMRRRLWGIEKQARRLVRDDMSDSEKELLGYAH